MGGALDRLRGGSVGQRGAAQIGLGAHEQPTDAGDRTLVNLGASLWETGKRLANLRIKAIHRLGELGGVGLGALNKSADLGDAALDAGGNELSALVGIRGEGEASLLGEELPAIEVLAGEAAGRSGIHGVERHCADDERAEDHAGQARSAAPEGACEERVDTAGEARRERLAAGVGAAGELLDLVAPGDQPLLKGGRQRGAGLTLDGGSRAQNRL